MPAAARRRPATTKPANEPAPASHGDVATPADGPTPAPAVTETTCPFHGRDIRVAIPTPEQLLALTLLADELAPAEDGSEPTVEFGDAFEALEAMNRMLNAVTSMIVDREDVKFVRDLLMAKRTTMEELAGFTKAALDTLVAANPSATKPKPGKRARLVLR